MLKAPVHNLDGKKSKEIKLDSNIFECEINEALVHQVIRADLANIRRGTASTKRRREKRGGGAKPWRQKGTGRARAGSIRSPLWKGGGSIFGPKPRDYHQKVLKKIRKLAIKSALSVRARDSEVIVVEKIDFKEAKTKEAAKILKKLNLPGKSTIVLLDKNEKVEKSFSNLPRAKVTYVSKLNPYVVLDNEVLIFTKDALERLGEVL